MNFRSCCDKLAGLADKVIQDFTDPFILQPASLDMANVKKKPDEELGIVLETAGVHGIHLVTETRMLNPSARVEPGDEIVQVIIIIIPPLKKTSLSPVLGHHSLLVILILIGQLSDCGGLADKESDPADESDRASPSPSDRCHLDAEKTPSSLDFNFNLHEEVQNS